MMSSKSDQIVPLDSATRLQIRDTVRRLVRDEKLLPPQTLERLRYHARCCREKLRLDDAFENYTMIMLNNMLWEDYFAHIPKEQRLLLLPICLRNHEHCKAASDELGLICEQCGSCVIPEITEKAENFGLNVLVAESSSSVGEWVERGELQGIIGVSCLNSLEKAFASMLRHAIPGIAIPLIADGCKDTDFDLSALDEALNIGEASPAYTAHNANIREHLKQLFAAEKISRYLNASTPFLRRFPELVYGALCDNGKHYRPMITFGTYCSLLNCSEFPDLLDPIAIAVECFHKASLIHDDIEDGDDTRYDKPTMHKQVGLPTALNAGDFLIGEGYRLLSHQSIPPELRAELYVQAARAHCELALGQAQEFESLGQNISLEQCLETHRLKTAPAFRVSLYMGAIAAGKFEQYREVFNSFADSLGVSYQLLDDLEDTHSNPASAVDCLMRTGNIDRETARAEISALYNTYKQKTFTTLEPINDSVLKTFLYRLSGRVLKDA